MPEMWEMRKTLSAAFADTCIFAGCCGSIGMKEDDQMETDEDILAISRLDEGVTLFGKNEDPPYAKMINSVKIHGEQ